MNSPTRSERKIKITKARDKALHTALSLDDYLYEKFRRLDLDLRERVLRYERNPKRLWEVIRQLPDGNFVREQVIACEVSGAGTRVIIR